MKVATKDETNLIKLKAKNARESITVNFRPVSINQLTLTDDESSPADEY